MNAATKTMILNWLAMHDGDVESLARWMHCRLRFGTKFARAAIMEAKEQA